MMAKFPLFRYALICTIGLVLTGCKSKSNFSDELFGKIEEDMYINDYFGFTMEIPENWILLNQDQIALLKNIGMKELVEDKNMRNQLKKAADVQSATLFFGGPLGSEDNFAYSLQIMAENLKDHPSITNGKKYLQSSMETMQLAGMPYAFDPEIHKGELGGKSVYIQDVRIPDTPIRQQFRVCMNNGFALLFLLTYNHEDEFGNHEPNASYGRF